MTSSARSRETLSALLVALACLVLPLAGALAAGQELAGGFSLPPEPPPDRQYPFRPVAAAAILLLALMVTGLLVRQVDLRPRVRGPAGRRFPGWGWIALGWTGTWWALAWSRIEALSVVQPYTFFPLWAGFVVTVNAFALRRHGACLMIDSPRRWLGLFAVSGAFWWGFEWLNRFVQNWHYVGVQHLGPLGYAVHASLAFSTVLPAVLAVREWLGDFQPRRDRRRWPSLVRPGSGFVLVILAAGALVQVGARPETFFWALWAAPLMLAIGLLILLRPERVLSLAEGDLAPAAAWAVAALICGFFWEMWNHYSEAHWVYRIPWVDRWPLFRMPILGYTGYVPFGMLCGLAVAWVTGTRHDVRSATTARPPRR